MAATLKALHSLRVGRHQIPPWYHTLNASIHHTPFLIYRSGFHSSTTASEISQHLTETCVAEPQWTCPIHVPSPPERFDAVVSSRDFLVVPARVAHRLLHYNEVGVKMVGAYPMGKLWNMCYGDEEE
ncbi:predicted protein [Histoplasma mississippiense (nom. inval.)]|uniref:predicted protein n=1 Tax=Ajellomyces capsulatus (strain NAm1 / WU24) TaxID=2059318 RepID=UPI000157D380|nr:predicted protein [Histoplasma mississippiense (nom. inval.)]EDN04795.1 predicted protein [Histoplasma mississippiense (nom. inval.)]